MGRIDKRYLNLPPVSEGATRRSEGHKIKTCFVDAGIRTVPILYVEGDVVTRDAERVIIETRKGVGCLAAQRVEPPTCYISDDTCNNGEVIITDLGRNPVREVANQLAQGWVNDANAGDWTPTVKTKNVDGSQMPVGPIRFKKKASDGRPSLEELAIIVRHSKKGGMELLQSGSYSLALTPEKSGNVDNPNKGKRKKKGKKKR